MLLFLNYVLGKVDRMNCEFQSEYFRLSALYSTISDEYRSILGMFIKPEVLESKKLSEINPAYKSLHLDLHHIRLGGRCDTFLIKEPIEENESRFRSDCQRFLVELCVQMQKRFPFDEQSVLALLKILDPKVALSPQGRIGVIPKLAVHFPTLIKEELDSLQEQWEDMYHARSSLQYLNQSPTCFWHELRGITDGNNKPKFDLLSKFMCDLLVLPHSSAAVERLFSQMNLIKTKKTNRLLTHTTASRLFAKQAIARQEVPCHEWKPSKSLISDLKSSKIRQHYGVKCSSNQQASEATLYPAEETQVTSSMEKTQVYIQ